MVQRSLAGLRAVIHARESKFEVKAGNRSTTEQVEESRDWCDQQGVSVAKVIVEDGVGASPLSKGLRSGKKRDDWEETKRLLAEGDENGPIDILVTWSATRGHRDLEEYVRLRQLCVETGSLWCYGGRVYDMTDGDDRFRTAMDGVVGERDSFEIRKNVMRGIRANIRKGRPHGRHLYGYRRVYDRETRALQYVEPHPDQAWVVQWIYATYLAGHGCNRIGQCLQFVNLMSLMVGTPTLPTPKAGPWNHSFIRRVLRNPAYKGRRTHNGEDVGEAMWPPLVDARTWERANRRLTANSTKANRASPRRKLLSGVALCSVCNTRLAYNPPWRHHVASYRCRNSHLSRSADKLEAYVLVALLKRLARRDANDVLDDDDEPPEVKAARGELTELQEELEDARRLRRGEVPGKRLSVMAFAEIETDLLARIEAAEARIRSAPVPIDISIPPADRLDGWWDHDLTDEQRREVVSAFIAGVTVRPAGRGKQHFDPSLIEIEWRRT